MTTPRPFIGRGRELDALSAALDGARTGRATVVLLAGEPGIGKSRMVEEAAALAQSRGVTPCWGRAWEAGGAPPYWPWIQILRALLKLAPASAVPKEISRLLPELAGGQAKESGGADDRFLLFDAVVRTVAAAAEGRPLLLILEDLHAADASTLQLLEFAAAHLRGVGCAVIGTYRELEVKLSPPTAELLTRVAREGQRFVLAPLGAAEVLDLARAISVDDQTAKWLHETTGGNPLFVTEMLHVLPRGRTAERTPLPEGVRAAIRQHLSALPPPLRGPLEVAAVIGRELNATLLAELTSAPLHDVLEQLAHAVSLGVLVERGPARFAFAHSLICDTLHHDLPARRRAELHLALADVLERAREGDLTPPLAEIAHHLFEAGPAVLDRAVDAARGAAERSLQLLAFEQADALLARAHDALSSAGKGAVTLRFELLLARGRALMLAGKDDEGRAVCRAAAAMVRSGGTAEQLARAALGYGFAFTFGMTDPQLVELLEEALRRLPHEDSRLRALAMARLAAALQPAADTSGPVATAREAIAMARRLGDARTRLDVFHAASAALARFSPAPERAELDEQTLALAIELSEPSLALRARARLAFDLIELGRVVEGWAQTELYEAQARDFRQPRLMWPAVMFRAMRALFEGRFDDQARHVAEAEALAQKTSDALLEFCIVNHGLCSDHIGRLATLADTSAEFRRRGQSRFYVQLAAATDAAHSGRHEEARALFSQADVVRTEDTALGMWAAEGLWALKEGPMARAIYDWLVPQERFNALWTMHGMAVIGPVARALYLLAAAMGRLDLARLHAERAVEQMRDQGGRPLVVHALLEWGEILLALGTPADRDEARTRLVEARAMSRELGLELDARFEAAFARAAPAEKADTLSLTREGELWMISGLGGLVRVKHSRGVEMLARLVATPRTEVSALDLSGSDGAVDAGDAGEVLDAEAKAAYRARLTELEEELEEAEGWNDPARADRLRQEADALKDELSRAVGLGGRSRRVGAATERARVNVQRRIADAIKKISDGHEGLGRHLESCVKTGAWCSYSPDRDAR